jgi:glycosyltransferase involved in cell wall biosynthesis
MPFPEFNHAGTPEILTILAILALIMMIAHYLFSFLPLSIFKRKESAAASLPPVSVIICAKNEEEHLTEFLPLVLKQEYPEFEVVVVNDCSWDNTESVIDEFAKIFPALRKANIKEDPYYKHGKKFAMLVGIKSAKYEHLVFTDADCFPSSPTWLKEMSSCFSDTTRIVVGYGAYKKEPGFLNKLIRYDAFQIAVQYFSAAIKKRPYMGVGRNLAYTRTLFFEQKGYSKHYHINSGDDDLFVNYAATANNTDVCPLSNAITYSIAKKTFRDWRLQKSRHLKTAPHYNAQTKAWLFFNYFSQYFYYASLISLAFHLSTAVLIPISLIVKSAAQVIILNKSASRLREKDLLFAGILFEFLLLIVYPVFHAARAFQKKEVWNH